MKIIQKKSKIKFINHDYKFRRLIFTSFIISFFSLLILGGGYFIAKKNGINLKIVKQWSGQITYWLPYHAKALFVSPKKISIHINHTNYQHLAFEREQALASSEYHRIGMNFNYVPAKIEYEDKLTPIKIRLKGDRQIHFEHSNQWSFRIKVKGDNTLFRMKNFSIQKPRARNYIHEWIFHEVLHLEGLISGRYFFADVNLNGNNLGIYAFEEHFEKRLIENNNLREAPILKFEENKSRDYRFSVIAPFDEKNLIDSVQRSYFNKANELLDGFRRGNLSISSVFDYNKLGKYFAITDLLQVPHGGLWKSIRFYYNPITSLIEPIGYDGHHGIDKMGDNSFLACEIGINPEARWIHEAYGNWFRMIFNDPNTFDNNFINSYFNALWELTDAEYLDDLFDEIGGDLEDNLILISRDFPLLADHALGFGPDLFTFSKRSFYDRQKRIRENLIDISLQVHIKSNEESTLTLKVGNPEMLPLSVNGLLINGNLISPTTDNFILPARKTDDYVTYHTLTFKSDTVLQKFITDSLEFVKLSYQLPGWGQIKEANILPFKEPYNQAQNEDLVRNIGKYNNYPFLDINELNKTIRFKTGQWVIEKDVVVPSGYKVLASEGVEIDLVKNACILSYSPLIFQGDPDMKIHVFSSDSTGQGIAILNANETSVFENVIFENLTNISRPGWILTSAITCYESNLIVKNSKFLNNHSEDYLNVFRSHFTITDSEFINVFSDAFDSDFSIGSFTNCVFFNCGNDAIDISGSTVLVDSTLIDGIGDKGLSAGENSELTAKNITIKNAEIAVTSKDLSKLFAESINIYDCRIGYTAFQKKSEFGSATILLTGGKMTNVELPYMLEQNSSLIVDGNSRNPDRENVQEILYGVVFGKSSKSN